MNRKEVFLNSVEISINMFGVEETLKRYEHLHKLGKISVYDYINAKLYIKRRCA